MGSLRVSDADAHSDSVSTYASKLARGDATYIAERLAYAGSRSSVVKNAKAAIESHIENLQLGKKQEVLAQLLNALMDLEKGYGVVEEQYIRERMRSFKIYLYVRLGNIMLDHVKLIRGAQKDNNNYGNNEN